MYSWAYASFIRGCARRSLLTGTCRLHRLLWLGVSPTNGGHTFRRGSRRPEPPPTRSLSLDGRQGLHSAVEARDFLGEVSLALRYGPASNLTIASMYRATQRQVPFQEDEHTAHARAFELTNGLLAGGTAIEINLIATRLVLAHERIMPTMFARRHGHVEPDLSASAQEALQLILDNEVGSSGNIRRC